MPSAPCCVCGFEAARYWRTVNGFRLYKCGACHALFVHPLPNDEELNALYGESYFAAGPEHAEYGYSDYEEKNYDWTPQRVSYYERLESFLLNNIGKDSKILDLGCATGSFLIFLRDSGWRNTYGLEYSGYAVTVARRYGLEVKEGRIEDADYPGDYFDAVFSHFVIEHIRDAHGFMRGIHRVLKPGGFLFCDTNDFGALRTKLINFSAHFGHSLFCEIKPPEHIIMYSKKTLKRLLELHSFDILDVSDTNGTCFSDFEYNNPILAKLKPYFNFLLKYIPADNEFIAIARKGTAV